MAQAVSRRPLTAEAKLIPGVIPCGGPSEIHTHISSGG
jgi:hypothetical protein